MKILLPFVLLLAACGRQPEPKKSSRTPEQAKRDAEVEAMIRATDARIAQLNRQAAADRADGARETVERVRIIKEEPEPGESYSREIKRRWEKDQERWDEERRHGELLKAIEDRRHTP